MPFNPTHNNKSLSLKKQIIMSNEPLGVAASAADETDCEYYDDDENMLYEIDNELEDDDDDDDEENYFENIIKEVISGQDIDANNNQLISNKLLQQLQQPLHHQQQQQQQQMLSTDSTQVIKVSEDDLIDQRDSLRTLFKTEVLDRYECRCDTNQGLFITKQAKLSKSLQRKLANFYQLLHHFQLQTTPQTVAVAAMTQQSESPAGGQITAILSQSVQNQEYKKKLFRSLRSIVERVLIDALMICDQYHSQLQQQEQQLQSNTSSNSNNNHISNSSSASSAATSQSQANNPTTKLWCEIRSRGCQFLGPQMQDDVLRLILHALETVTRMSRKVLVLYVVHMLKKHYPKASKTSVGHVVQLLYRAGCFKVEKRENDSSLMELKKEFSKYQALRRQHDTQIIQIALESGIRMSPEQWSQKLFGDSNHKSEMQSIIDKLQSQQTLEKLIADFYDKLSTNLMTTTVGSASSSPSCSFSVQTNAHTQLALQHRNSNSSNSSSSSSASSQSSNSSTNSHLDVAISSLFLQVKAEFEFFAMINFEKKSPALSGTNSSGKRNSELGSGGESLASEDESSFTSPDHDLNSFDFDDDFDSLTSKSYAKSIQQQQQQQQQQPEQAKIVWSLLLDCLKRSSKILASHIEYTAKMMSLIIANSNSSSINSSNTSATAAAAAAAVTSASSTSNLSTIVNNTNNRKQQQPLQRQINYNSNNNNSRFDYQDDEINSQQHSFANSIARTLVAMGPNTQTNNFNRSKPFAPNNKNNQRNNINTNSSTTNSNNNNNSNITKNKAANSNGFSFNATPSTAATATSIGSSNTKFNNNLFGSIYSSDFASNINLPTSAGLTKPPGFFQQQTNTIFDSNILNNVRGKNFFDPPKTINKPFYQQTAENSSLFHHQSSPYSNHFNKQPANIRNVAKHFSDE